MRPPVPCQAASCRRLIDFALPDDKDGPAHPVDHDSAGAADGRLEVWRDAAGILRYRVLKVGEQPRPGRLLGRSHYGTCSDPGVFRRRDRR